VRARTLKGRYDQPHLCEKPGRCRCKPHACEGALGRKCLQEAIHQPDPYDQDVNKDNTLHWLCDQCADTRAEDI
jgi:hypothetical protein